ncbi:MAG: hypothetical protein ACUVQ1_03120 [Candidatus Kapaibacteriales bacterium]
MKHLILFTLLICVYTLFAIDTIIQNFTATSNGRDIIIEFRTLSEKNVTRFEIERSVNNSPFKKLTSFDPKGPSSYYKYIDEGAFLKENENTPQANNYSYRIKIIFADKSYSFSNTVTVSHVVNGLFRTWGMIKEMFR